VTRRQTPAANVICLIAGMAIGAILAPLASARHHHATLIQLGVFSVIGVLIAAAYRVIGSRLSMERSSRVAREFDTVFE
jgi:hypothetical protein